MGNLDLKGGLIHPAIKRFCSFVDIGQKERICVIRGENVVGGSILNTSNTTLTGVSDCVRGVCGFFFLTAFFAVFIFFAFFASGI
jgi:hypothetical protein